MKIITIIPARGGSKSLPKKNILLLKGKPLLCHSIDYSLKSQLVTSTVVSTDMEEIANIAKNSGASVPFLRPDEFAQDDTRDYPVIRHALDFFESQGEIFDFYILLRPTSPLRPPGLIEKAFEIFKNNIEASSVRSMARIKELFFQTGDIEVIRRETIISGSISGDSVYPLIIEHEDMIDIDSKSDLDRAEKSNAKT